jgi:hypothetical protein
MVKCPLHEIIRLNGEATACMQVPRRLDDAVPLFQKALALLKVEAAKPNDETDHNDIVVAQLGGEVKMGNTDPSNDGVFSYSRHTFSFTCQDESAKGESSFSEKDQNVMLSILLYNLASSHHQVGLLYGRSHELSIALRLYHLVVSTLANIGGDTSSFEDEVLLLLLCSLYNNIGHIHSCFQEADEAKFCLEWLQNVLQSEKTLYSKGYEKEYIFFFQYLVLSPDEQFCLASAA